MALRCHKLLASGETLTIEKISMICLMTAIEYDLNVRPPSKKSEKVVNDLLHFTAGNETEFGTLLKKQIEKSKNAPANKRFWPDKITPILPASRCI